jgi:hypothetical protein
MALVFCHVHVVDGRILCRAIARTHTRKYCMVVSESMLVITVYEPTSPTVVEQIQAIANEKYSMKQHQRELRSQKTDEYYMLKEGKYRNMEFEVGYNSYSYA